MLVRLDRKLCYHLPMRSRSRLAPVLKTIFHHSLKQFFINGSYHKLVASRTLMALFLKQFFINWSYHKLVASLTLMALFF